MVEKMIRNTIIEIGIIIIFIVASFFIWPYFQKELDYNLVNALENETKLELLLNNVGGYDNVIVNNEYNTNKTYQIVLITTSNCDNAKITINNKESSLLAFPKEKRGENYAYILATDNIQSSRKGYKILLNLDKKITNYYYQLEELTYF